MSAPEVHASTRRWAGFLLAVDLLLWGCVALPLPLPGWLRALYGYVAFSLLTVGLLYAWAARGRNPGAVLKGHRWPWAQALFWPFRGVALSVWALARVVRFRQDPVSLVVPGVALGIWLPPWETHRLEREGLAAVLDLCAELPTNPRLAGPSFARLELPVLDRCPPTPEELHRAVRWVLAQREEGRGVYLHCAFGRGRSAMVTAASLVALGHASSAEEALALVRRARPTVSVKGAQRAALEAFVLAWREDSA